MFTMPGFRLFAAVLGSQRYTSAFNFMSPPTDVDGFETPENDLPIRQELRNVGDVQYTLPLVVGGQSISAIPDTGSFDLLVFSTRCVKCGGTANLFDDSVSSSYASSDMDAEQTFGSGKTESIEAFDTAGLGTMHVQDQVFWEVVDADMPLLSKATFQAILGVGPPRGAVKIADKEAAGMVAEVSAMQDEGRTVPDAYMDTVKHYAEVAKRVRNQTPILKRLDMESFSICLHREAASSGTWIWRDNMAKLQPSLFINVPVIGNTYWSADLSSVRLAAGSVALPTLHDSDLVLGCGNNRCLGVVDTGTSLFVMPSAAYKLVSEAISMWSDQGSDCTDLSLLPNLEFKLGGKDFSLPPESYVGQMNGELPSELAAYMPHAKRRFKDLDGNCMPLLMATDDDSPEGEIWILGLPLFRKYYTTFNLEEGSERGKSLSFALADAQCQPQLNHESLYREAEAPRKPLRIDASKIRMPRLGSRGRLHDISQGTSTAEAPQKRPQKK